jgi:hypothetical protein
MVYRLGLATRPSVVARRQPCLDQTHIAGSCCGDFQMVSAAFER